MVAIRHRARVSQIDCAALNMRDDPDVPPGHAARATVPQRLRSGCVWRSVFIIRGGEPWPDGEPAGC
jgi:hypothetical protein